MDDFHVDKAIRNDSERRILQFIIAEVRDTYICIQIQSIKERDSKYLFKMIIYAHL